VKAEAEARRLAEERRQAEAKAAAEAKVREEARLQAEAEARRLSEEKRLAEERMRAEAEAKAKAEAAARAEAEARQRAEAEAQEKAVASRKAEQAVQAPPAGADPVMATQLKTKVSNVDVVNRSLDRSQMTIGVEFEYRDSYGSPMLGVDIFKTGDPLVTRYFQSQPLEIGKSRRNFMLFPVRFQPGDAGPKAVTTDKVLVYLQDATPANKAYVQPATMLLTWKAPGTAAMAAVSGDVLELEDFRQNDPQSGVLSVKYSMASSTGRLRARIFDSRNAASAGWIEVEEAELKQARGRQNLSVSLKTDAPIPAQGFAADTIEITLLDAAGKPVSTLKKEVKMNWSKAK
jgi:hypothetical protein